MEASNLQELKDAATELMRFTCNSCERRFCEDDSEEEDGQSSPSPCSAIIRMRNALSSNPLRNCDVGTAEEQAERMRLYCNSHGVDEIVCFRCDKCPLLTVKMCELAWAQLPYEAQEGGAK